MLLDVIDECVNGESVNISIFDDVSNFEVNVDVTAIRNPLSAFFDKNQLLQELLIALWRHLFARDQCLKVAFNDATINIVVSIDQVSAESCLR